MSKLINDGGATKKESRSRAWLVDAQCRAVLRRDWKAERAYEARIMGHIQSAWLRYRQCYGCGRIKRKHEVQK